MKSVWISVIDWKFFVHFILWIVLLHNWKWECRHSLERRCPSWRQSSSVTSTLGECQRNIFAKFYFPNLLINFAFRSANPANCSTSRIPWKSFAAKVNSCSTSRERAISTASTMLPRVRHRTRLLTTKSLSQIYFCATLNRYLSCSTFLIIFIAVFVQRKSWSRESEWERRKKSGAKYFKRASDCI